MSGWIKLHRGLIEWEWYDDINTRCLFIHCLLRANHADKNWRGIDIKRGTFLTSLEALAKETHLSVSQIRTSIRKLETTGEIASLSQARSRVITVLNYDSYQGDDKINDKKSDRVVTGSSQADDRVVTTNKNVKKEKNEKNEKKNIEALDFSPLMMTDSQVSELQRIRKQNKGGKITQGVIKGLAKEFGIARSSGLSTDDILLEWETRGWKSVKAEWMTKRPQLGAQSFQQRLDDLAASRGEPTSFGREKPVQGVVVDQDGLRLDHE